MEDVFRVPLHETEFLQLVHDEWCVTYKIFVISTRIITITLSTSTMMYK